MVIALQDALGHQSNIKFDDYLLLPIEVTDPVGLKTKAVYDYRVMQPKEVTDPNGNQTTFTFSPMGLLNSTWIKGKPSKGEGDQTRASVEMTYDFLAFENSPEDNPEPIYVSALRYTHHDTEDVSLQQKIETIKTVEYSDGFGRLLQTRTQGERTRFGGAIFGGGVLPEEDDDPKTQGYENTSESIPNVVVSGWQIYDNKGRVVEKYEPFFSTGWDYAQPEDEQFGQKAIMFYDPRGQVIRTLNPDGSEQRVIYGLPIDLTDPEQFAPTPWEVYTYDANDNAGRTHADDSKDYEYHWNTPASAMVDSMGRTIAAIERNRAPGSPLKPIEEYITRSTYDIQGNLLTVTDALGRPAFTHLYDLIKRPLRVDSIDAGTRLSVPDALGNPVEQIDSKGAVIIRTYDVLNRPIGVWARDNGSGAVTLRERIEYGDGSDKNQPNSQRNASKTANRLGKPHKHYDEAGLLTFEKYDFKGNILEKKRKVIADSAILEKLDPTPLNWEINAYSVNWNTSVTLDSTEYATSFAYDALNRIKTMLYPEAKDESGNKKRSELQPHYNRAGALESVKLDGATYVERIVYNAKGQRTLIAYDNNVMTRYAYYEKTFRLASMQTEYYTKPDDLTYQPDTASSRDEPLQDFAYEYDLAGNILFIHDRTPGCGIKTQRDQLDRTFSYDPLYRLLDATGRQCDVLPSETPGQPWNAGSCCEDVNSTRFYTENYEYDPMGNIKSLVRSGGPTGFTRDFTFVPGTNRLYEMDINSHTYSYTYDDNGNLTRENASRHFDWDYADRMRVFRFQTDGAEPTSYVHCLYDSGGNRVKKLVRNPGAPVEVTVYIDGIFEHCRSLNEDGTTKEEDNTLHVMDNQNRIALVRIGKFIKDKTPPIKYQLGDHLGSSNVVIDDSGAVVNREEFTPYGETSFGRFEKKRYRFTGKERDGESGLYYHGARYYAPWLGRWVSVDPLYGDLQSHRSYAYADNRPLIAIDPDGRHPALIVLIGVGILVSLTIPNIANAPEQNTKTIPHITAGEFAAQFAIAYGSGGLGGKLTQGIIAKTGTTLLGSTTAGFLGYGAAGLVAGPLSVATRDVATGQCSTPQEYGKASLTMGLVAGVFGAAVTAFDPPNVPSPVSQGRVLNIGGELESKPGDIVLNQPATAQVSLKTIATDTGALVVAGRAEALPFKSGSFTSVEGHNLAPNTINWQKAAPEINRMLEPGGTVDLSVRGGEAPSIAQSLASQGISAKVVKVNPLSVGNQVTGVKSK